MIQTEIQTSISSTESFTEKMKSKAKKALAAVALTTTTVAVGANILNNETETHEPIVPAVEHIATPGDTLTSLTQDVKNVDDRRDVMHWSEKNSPDLQDGSVDVGDTVITPVDANDIK